MRFNKSYVYPWWAYCIGWFLASSSIIMIPVTMIWKLAKGKGTLWQVSGVVSEWRDHLNFLKRFWIYKLYWTFPSVSRQAPCLQKTLQWWQRKCQASVLHCTFAGVEKTTIFNEMPSFKNNQFLFLFFEICWAYDFIWVFLIFVLSLDYFR